MRCRSPSRASSQRNLSFLASYWFSKSLDYISSLNVAGSAPTLVAGENDLAQNPVQSNAPSMGRLCSTRRTASCSAELMPLPALAERSRARGLLRERMAV